MKKVTQSKAKTAKPAKTVKAVRAKARTGLQLVGSKKTTAAPKATKKASREKAKNPPAQKAKSFKPQPTGSNVIWKFLQMKEARRKEQAEMDQHPRSSTQEAANSQKNNLRHHQFARFAGPRRRSSS